VALSFSARALRPVVGTRGSIARLSHQSGDIDRAPEVETLVRGHVPIMLATRGRLTRAVAISGHSLDDEHVVEAGVEHLRQELCADLEDAKASAVTEQQFLAHRPVRDRGYEAGAGSWTSPSPSTRKNLNTPRQRRYRRSCRDGGQGRSTSAGGRADEEVIRGAAPRLGGKSGAVTGGNCGTASTPMVRSPRMRRYASTFARPGPEVISRNYSSLAYPSVDHARLDDDDAVEARLDKLPVISVSIARMLGSLLKMIV
jgi:hypothetical protein